MSKSIFLEKLVIKNFATFENQEIDFKEDFNAIVGETGSGKSLIIDALQLILGQRANKKLIRKSCEFAQVEAIFSVTDKNTYSDFDDLGFPIVDDLISIKRIIYSTGKSKCFLNSSPCSLSLISDFTKKFIDLVGQFDNQKLLSSEYQLQLLDNYFSSNSCIEKYKGLYSQYKANLQKSSAIRIELNGLIEKKDYITFQIAQLEKLNPSIERELELINEKESLTKQINNKNYIAEALYLISESENSSINSMIKKLINTVSNIDTKQSSELNEKLHASIDLINDVSYSLSKGENIEESQTLVDEILDELSLYNELKRKFNTDTVGLANKFSQFKNELNSIKKLELSLNELQKLTLIQEKELFEMALVLHKQRLSAAKEISSKLTKVISNLNMEGATINIEVHQKEDLSSSGISTVIYKAETNKGEGYYKLSEIASGGELSRILLAVRQILSSKETISVFLFDEIDTGVGGETALKIGNALFDVSKASQVIAITHLPQIAKFANSLVFVEKESIEQDKDIRTYSKISLISKSKDRAHFVKGMTPL